MTLSLEEAVKSVEELMLYRGAMMEQGQLREILMAYARHCVEKAAFKDGFNAGTADYHSRLLEEISK
jgi:hypothetical protein